MPMVKSLIIKKNYKLRRLFKTLHTLVEAFLLSLKNMNIVSIALTFASFRGRPNLMQIVIRQNQPLVSLNALGVTLNFDLNTVAKYACDEKPTLNEISEMDRSSLSNKYFAFCILTSNI